MYKYGTKDYRNGKIYISENKEIIILGIFQPLLFITSVWWFFWANSRFVWIPFLFGSDFCFFFHNFIRIHGIRLIHIFLIFQDCTGKNDQMNWKYISCNARFIWADFHFCIGICNQIQIDERIRSQDTHTQLKSMALYQKIAKFHLKCGF